MKSWYQKKKVWASIIGALAVVLTIFLAPADVDRFEVIAAAVLEAALAAGFVFAESSIDKASATQNARDSINGALSFLHAAKSIVDDGSARKAGFIAKDIAAAEKKIREELADQVKEPDDAGGG